MSVRLFSSSAPPAAFYNGKDSTVDHVIYSRGALPERFVRHALDIFNEHNLDPPDMDRHHILVAAAIEAMSLFFVASLFDPDTVALQTFFREVRDALCDDAVTCPRPDSHSWKPSYDPDLPP
jgi:hypothetical protein